MMAGEMGRNHVRAPMANTLSIPGSPVENVHIRSPQVQANMSGPSSALSTITASVLVLFLALYLLV